jgi:hypothetical protein
VLRKAVILAAEAGSERVGDAHVTAALDELQHDRAALTRVLLGAAGEGRAPSATEWLEAGPGWGPFPEALG